MSITVPVKARVLHDITVPNKKATDEPVTIISCTINKEANENPFVI